MTKLKWMLGTVCLSTIALTACSTPSTNNNPSPTPQASTTAPSTQPMPDGTKPPTQPTAKPSSKSSLSYKLETYRSEVFGSDRTYGVVLPPGYEQNSQARYPVVFLLHGGHGDPTSWYEKGDALPIIEDVFKSRKLPPSIIITPDGNDVRGSSAFWDPQYIDGKNGNVSSAIGDELVQVIKSRYRTKEQPQFWAIGGLSSGGWGALNVGLHHSQNFKTMFSHSGYFSDKSGVENSPIQFIQTLPPNQLKDIAIYIDAGESDGEYLTETEAFHRVLTQLQVENEFNVFPGGHGTHGNLVGWGFWRRHLVDSLSFVGKQFQSATVAENSSKTPVSQR